MEENKVNIIKFDSSDKAIEILEKYLKFIHENPSFTKGLAYYYCRQIIKLSAADLAKKIILDLTSHELIGYNFSGKIICDSLAAIKLEVVLFDIIFNGCNLERAKLFLTSFNSVNDLDFARMSDVAGMNPARLYKASNVNGVLINSVDRRNYFIQRKAVSFQETLENKRLSDKVKYEIEKKIDNEYKNLFDDCLDKELNILPLLIEENQELEDAIRELKELNNSDNFMIADEVPPTKSIQQNYETIYKSTASLIKEYINNKHILDKDIAIEMFSYLISIAKNIEDKSSVNTAYQELFIYIRNNILKSHHNQAYLDQVVSKLIPARIISYQDIRGPACNSVQEIYSNILKLIKDLLCQTSQTLGSTYDNEFTVLLLGSLATGKVNLYSDVEYLIIINNSSIPQEFIDYLSVFMNLFEALVSAFGETGIVSAAHFLGHQEENYKEFHMSGFQVSASNRFKSRTNEMGQIITPESLVKAIPGLNNYQFQSALLSAKYIYGNPDYYQKYIKLLNDKLSTKQYITTIKQCLKYTIAGFKPHATDFNGKESTKYSLKEMLMYSTEVLKSFAYLLRISFNNLENKEDYFSEIITKINVKLDNNYAVLFKKWDMCISELKTLYVNKQKEYKRPDILINIAELNFDFLDLYNQIETLIDDLIFQNSQDNGVFMDDKAIVNFSDNNILIEFENRSKLDLLSLVEQAEGEHNEIVLDIVSGTESDKVLAKVNELFKLNDDQTVLKERDLFGNQIIHWASLAGRVDIIAGLKTLGFSPSQPGMFGFSCIHQAIFTDKTETLKSLLPQSNDPLPITIKQISGEDLSFKLLPLHTSIVTDSINCAAMLLDYQKEYLPLEIANFGNILHLAVFFRRAVLLHDMLQKLGNKRSVMLLEQNTGESKYNVLSYAAIKNHISCIDIIMNYYTSNSSVKNEAQNQSPLIALCYAIEAEKFDSVQRLLGWQINPEERVTSGDFKDKTPYEISRSCSNQRIKNIIHTTMQERSSNTYRIPNLKSSPVANLVFQGGGVKGIAYVGAIQALEYSLNERAKNYQNNQMGLDFIKRVAGTSAGSILACLIAIGYSSEECKNILSSTNFMDFVKGLDINKLLASGGLFDKLKAIAEKQEVNISILHPLNTLKELLSKPGLCSGNEFLQWLSELIVNKLTEIKEKDHNIANLLEGKNLAYLTFGDLAQLVNSGSSYRFKHLHVIASRLKNDNELNEIESMHSESDKWKDVLIIDAVRASMSFPGVFVPYQLRKINPHDPKNEPILFAEAKYVDGGVAKNYAIEEFDKLRYLPTFMQGDNDKYEQNPYTLGFQLFDEVSEAENQNEAKPAKAISIWNDIVGQINNIKSKIDFKEKIGGYVFKQGKEVLETEFAKLLISLATFCLSSEELIANYQNVRKGRSILIGNAGVPTLKFSLEKYEIDKLVERGEKATCGYFEVNHSAYKASRETNNNLDENKLLLATSIFKRHNNPKQNNPLTTKNTNLENLLKELKYTK